MNECHGQPVVFARILTLMTTDGTLSVRAATDRSTVKWVGPDIQYTADDSIMGYPKFNPIFMKNDKKMGDINGSKM